MDGKEVFKFAVSKVPEVIMEVLEKAGKTKEEIRFYMLHQANKRIVASVSKHMNEPLEKYPMNIENLGNTSSASIPLLLDEWNKKGRLNYRRLDYPFRIWRWTYLWSQPASVVKMCIRALKNKTIADKKDCFALEIR